MSLCLPLFHRLKCWAASNRKETRGHLIHRFKVVFHGTVRLYESYTYYSQYGDQTPQFVSRAARLPFLILIKAFLFQRSSLLSSSEVFQAQVTPWSECVFLSVCVSWSWCSGGLLEALSRLAFVWWINDHSMETAKIKSNSNWSVVGGWSCVNSSFLDVWQHW